MLHATILASMDVKPEPAATPVTEVSQPKPTPVMDVVAPPPAAEPAGAASISTNPSPIVNQPAKKPGPEPKKPTTKAPGSGTTAAIVATVIIVLVLSILAVYAYIKTAK